MKNIEKSGIPKRITRRLLFKINGKVSALPIKSLRKKREYIIFLVLVFFSFLNFKIKLIVFVF